MTQNEDVDYVNENENEVEDENIEDSIPIKKVKVQK